MEKLREANESFNAWRYKEVIYNVKETPARYCYTQGYQAALNQPKHETVEQWEERTGETYPDDGPLWWWVPMKGLEKWKLTTRVSVDLKYDIEKVYGKHKCIVANHHGKPEEV